MYENTFDSGKFKTIHSFRGGIRKLLTFEEEWHFDYQTPYWIRVIEENICLDLFVFLRPGKKIIFSGQDALMEGRRELPYFYRTKWISNLPCSFVTFNDPSLYLEKNFGAGYFCLPKSWEMVKRAVDKIILSKGYLEVDTHFYGASAGGYWALSMAGSYPLSTFVVDIPQVNLETYFRENKNDFREAFSLGSTLPCVFDFWQPNSIFPKHIFYFQNSRDIFHIRTQQSFFLSHLGKFSAENAQSMNNVSFLYYQTPPDTRAHSPLPQEKTLEFLGKLIDGSINLEIK